MLSWEDAALIAGVLTVLSALGRLLTSVLAPRIGYRLRIGSGVAWEAGLLIGLYALWQFAGSFTVMNRAGGLARGQWIWHAERVLHLPSEAAVQRLFLPYPAIIQAFNLYYDILHFPMLIACLIWVYAWHRADYPRIRTIVALFTAASLAVQLIPVAPPRLLPGAGMVDTAFKYGQSVYTWNNGALAADQYSAMPSVHVGWALIVAIAVITVSRNRWRWLALAYPALTLLVVVVTANHFWLDGVAAAALVGLAILVQRAVSKTRSRPEPAAHGDSEQEPVSVGS